MFVFNTINFTFYKLEYAQNKVFLKMLIYMTEPKDFIGL